MVYLQRHESVSTTLTVVSRSDGVGGYYEMAIHQVKKFDAHAEVFTEDKYIKVTVCFTSVEESQKKTPMAYGAGFNP